MISLLIIPTNTLLDICDFNTEDVGGWKDLFVFLLPPVM